MKCYGCKKTILFGELLKCSVCRKTYDYKCLNISTPYYLKHFNKPNYSWECLSCVTEFQRSIDNVLMDNQSSTQEMNVYNVLLRLENLPLENDDSVPKMHDATHYLPDTSNISYEQFRTLFYKKFNKIRSGLYCTGLESPLEKNIIKCNHLLDLTSASLCFLRNEINNRPTTRPEDPMTRLRLQLIEFRTKFELMARSSNLEIQMVPESENENLLDILKAIGTAVKASIQEKAVLNIRRIAKMDTESQRPRNILVSFPTQYHRDDVLSAFRVYNIQNKSDPLNTTDIGMPGEKRNIFLCEHLTPQSKEVHIETKNIAKKLGFKYVWVRNDSVYIRKNDQSPAFHIRNMADVHKLRYYDLFY